ncbi:MAG: hypothetical protein EOM24_03550 [Chloroflexia bacterium]|nr:hypothetical protein [Chloroflexia bacterium]
MAYNQVQQWILEHDDSLIFNLLYLGLALILSMTLGLFWLIAVVGIHAILEVTRQYYRSSRWGFAVAETIWELKLDLALILFAFVLAVYLDYIFGIAGLSAGSRAVAQTAGQASRAGSRVVLWQRLIRGFFLSLDDIALAIRAFAGRLRGKTTPVAPAQPEVTAGLVAETPATPEATNATNTQPPEPLRTSWQHPYSRGDYASLGFGGVCLLMLFIAPGVLNETYADVWQIIVDELRPFAGLSS